MECGCRNIFAPERIESGAARYGVDGKRVPENILGKKALHSESSPLP